MVVATLPSWFQLGGSVIGTGIVLGVWRSYLPYDSLVWLLALFAAGATVAQYFPAWMPLMTILMAAYGILCLAVARDVLLEERAFMARLRR